MTFHNLMRNPAPAASAVGPASIAGEQIATASGTLALATLAEGPASNRKHRSPGTTATTAIKL